MLEKETYGKMKKMCNELGEIKKLLLIQTEILTLSVFDDIEETEKENVYFSALQEIEKMKIDKKKVSEIMGGE